MLSEEVHLKGYSFWLQQYDILERWFYLDNEKTKNKNSDCQRLREWRDKLTKNSSAQWKYFLWYYNGRHLSLYISQNTWLNNTKSKPWNYGLWVSLLFITLFTQCGVFQVGDVCMQERGISVLSIYFVVIFNLIYYPISFINVTKKFKWQ